ncbi:MAG TPA: glycosyltransferase [Gaiellaceae bacterium]|jgi:glycosyltransferase involved in cell wall biosynthesis|nr:glycosyltransferase [Gaiellaceae bacterium]
MSRFPRLSETFVLYEMLAVEEQGVEVQLYPLIRERAHVVHPEALELCERARFQPFLSAAVLRSQLHFLRRSPRRYLGTLRDLLVGTWGSLNFFAGALAIFPKVAHNARLMQGEGIDHVHCHFSNHPAAAGFVIHRLTGIPFSFTAHGSDLHVDRHMLGEKLAEAAFAVPISRYNRDLMIEECGESVREKLVVIHCGVDTQVFRPGARERREGRFTVLSVGTLHEVKGQANLVEACRLLQEEGIDVVCDLVGDGPDRKALSRQIEAAGLGGRVTLLGLRDRSEVAELLRKADVLAAPSVPTRRGKREGIPVVLMEAMASGVPVVASRVSGIPELVEDGVSGLLVTPGDPRSLADALARMHADAALREALAREARAKVEAEFDVRQNARKLVRQFEAHARVPA